MDANMPVAPIRSGTDDSTPILMYKVCGRLETLLFICRKKKRRHFNFKLVFKVRNNVV